MGGGAPARPANAHGLTGREGDVGENQAGVELQRDAGAGARHLLHLLELAVGADRVHLLAPRGPHHAAVAAPLPRPRPPSPALSPRLRFSILFRLTTNLRSFSILCGCQNTF